MVESMSAVQWGPVAVWVGAIATFGAALVALLASIGWFGRLEKPKLELTFESTEPWCRQVGRDSTQVMWVRVGVENTGRTVARGCLGRLIRVSTGGSHRSDIDPVQLRWAGVPRSRSFEPVDIRRGQSEFLNVLFSSDAGWRIDTFEGKDFDPGFVLTLGPESHDVEIAVFADNADTEALTFQFEGGAQPHAFIRKTLDKR
jgi:hypothetical protein